MMPSTDLVVIGDTNLDLLLQVERFPSADDEVEANGVLSLPGGNAANVAAQAARLGLKTALVSAVGDDEQGKRVISDLQAMGIDLSALKVILQQNTGTVVSIIRKDGQRAMVASRGANERIELDVAAAGLFKAAKIVHVSDPPEAVLEELPRLIRETSAPLSFDPGSISATRGLDALRPVLERCRYLFINQNEMALLTNSPDENVTARSLLDLGIGILFLKLGAGGCRIFTGTREFSIAAYPVSCIDATGAGDAFDAAMLYALLHELPMDEAGRFANAVGALTTLGVGAQTSQPDLARVKEFLKGK